MRYVYGIGLTSALLGLPACGERRPAAEPASSDGRQSIEVPVEVRDAIRLEMRTMLGSLHTLLAAGARGDTLAMREAAARSGLAPSADVALEKLLPEKFLKLGMSTHRQFDELAVALPTGLPADSLVARLGRITANCVACHETYGLATPPTVPSPRP